MKTRITALISLLSFLSAGIAQPQTIKKRNDLEQINYIFDRIEAQGVDTKQDLLYGYFFYDKDQSKLEKLKDDLLRQSYRFVELSEKDNGEWMLHVEKVEKHTRHSLQMRDEILRKMAAEHEVSMYDGF